LSGKKVFCVKRVNSSKAPLFITNHHHAFHTSLPPVYSLFASRQGLNLTSSCCPVNWGRLHQLRPQGMPTGTHLFLEAASFW
jgi:hypothetical protein